MAKWTAEQFTNELSSILGPGLVSVILYGSRAAGDHLEERSDTNLLALVKKLDVPHLKRMSKVVTQWVKQGNQPPLLLTPDHLHEYVNVFPLEISDIQQNHYLLYGVDPFPDLKVSHDYLRQELEHELQGKLLQLKTRYLLTGGRDKKVVELMTQSLSTFLVLLKNALWLYGEKPPLKKMEAAQKLGERLGLKTDVFGTIGLLKQGEKIPNLDISALFETYLETLESFVDKIDV